MSQGLKPSTDLSNRIAQIYPSLSNGHRRAADFVLQHPLDVATMTIEGLAEGSGTSMRFRSNAERSSMNSART